MGPGFHWSARFPCLRSDLIDSGVSWETTCGAGYFVLDVAGQSSRVGHSVGCAEHPRPRVGLPCLRSALIVLIVGIELESRNSVRMLVKSKFGNFVCRIRKLVNSFGDWSMARSSTEVKLVAARVCPIELKIDPWCSVGRSWTTVKRRTYPLPHIGFSGTAAILPPARNPLRHGTPSGILNMTDECCNGWCFTLLYKSCRVIWRAVL